MIRQFDDHNCALINSFCLNKCHKDTQDKIRSNGFELICDDCIYKDSYSFNLMAFKTQASNLKGLILKELSETWLFRTLQPIAPYSGTILLATFLVLMLMKMYH